MRKLLILLVVMMSWVATSAQSYNNAIGVRGTYFGGITFKHMMGDSKGLEFIANSRWRGYNITGLYEIHAQAFDVEGLNWYYGIGGHLSRWSEKYYFYKNYPPASNGYYTVIGIDGIIGIEYNISDIPINISLDYKPAFNLIGYQGGWWDSGAFSVRYYF